MLAWDVESVRDWGLAVVGGSVVLAIVLAVVVRAIISKLVVVAVLTLLAAVVWQQRTSVQDCADRVGHTLAPGGRDSTTCTFFGRDVTVGSPLG